MKPQFIKFDKKRPVFFGFSAMAVFEEETDIKFSKIADALQDMSIQNTIAFVYAGLVGGAKKTKKEVDFSIDDVADWLDEVEDLEKVFESFINCMPMMQPDKSEKGKGSKKK